MRLGRKLADLEELTRMFQQLGAPNPASWARSEIEEGFPQLARFVFLRAAWKNVRPNEDVSWIKEVLSRKSNQVGGAAVGALRRALESGIAPRDLTTITRDAQWSLLFGLCYLLSNGGDPDGEAENIRWGLFQLGDDEQPTVALDGLHESVLETDPTEREMRSETNE